MAIVNFNSVSGVSTISATSSVTVGTGLTITTSGVVGITSINNGPISGARNRIINGDMRIDQRNAGSAVTPSPDAYTLDRWYCAELTDGAVTVQRVADGPSGFTNSAKITVSTADSSLAAGQITHFTQYLEGLNVDDLAFGTSSAKTITISFWVKSSVTGTFSGSLANHTPNRSYPFTYTINSANTWEYETITIPGDTTGTWATDNSKSFALNFSLGSGSTYAGTAGAWSGSDFRAATSSTNLMATLNATWNITGVQLEVGPTATEFERRSYGQELALCQRYYEKSYALNTAPGTNADAGNVIGRFFGSGDPKVHIRFSVAKRAAPTMTFYTPAGTLGSWRSVGTINADRTVTSQDISEFSANAAITSTMDQLNGHWVASIEL